MKSVLFFGVLVWFSAAVSGGVYLTRFESTPAEANVGYPSDFPAESRLERDINRPTLIFFAHPKCPCTRAALSELSRLMTVIDGKVTAHVVFIRPKDESDDWASTDLLEIARGIPRVQVTIDRDDRETNIFNAQTSSLALLYDRSGTLRFNGGITAARGHEGDNAGRSAISEIVATDTARTAETPVFGCPLHKKDCAGEAIEPAP
jgi:hypothetical protein